MSFEQFERTFKEAFGRDMTPDERRWLRLANFLNSDEVIEQADFEDDAAQADYTPENAKRSC